MKKHIVIILLLLIAIGAKAQIVSTNSNEGGTYFFSSNGSGQMNTQKILKYDSISHIILTQTVSTNQSRFCLVEQGNIYTKYVDVPAQYKVNDFSILNDTVYFCGQENRGNSITRGFIGYISKEDLFTELGSSSSFNFTPLNLTTCDSDSCFTIRKIMTYHNNLGVRIVAGIGSIYYGEAAADCLQEVFPGEDALVLTYHPKYYYDCLMIYKVTEEQLVSNQQAVNHTLANPTYATGNKVYFYVTPISSTYGYSLEQFEDITLTNDYICVVSVAYMIGSIANNPTNYNNIFIRKFDKNNFNQVSNKIVLATEGHIVAGVKIEYVGNNKIALAYTLNSGKDVGTYVTKINLETSPFTIIHTSFVDYSELGSTLLCDLEYMSNQDSLLLLKRSLINNNLLDKVYYLNIKDNATFAYTTKYLTVNTPQIYWYNILYNSEQNRYAIVGENNNIVRLFDNIILDDERECYIYVPIEITSYNTPIDTATNLVQCDFPEWSHFTSDGQLYVVHLGTNIYNAILKYLDLSIVAQGKVYNSCIYQR